MALGESLLSLGVLENAIQLGWWQDPMSSSPSQLSALGSFQISDQGGSWIRTMSNWVYDSSIELVMIEFFWTFWEKILSFCIIIEGLRRSLQSGWSSICCHGSRRIFLCATPYGSDVSRRDKYSNRLDDCLYSLSTWRSEDTAHLSWFWAWVG